MVTDPPLSGIPFVGDHTSRAWCERFVRELSHEINNALMAISGSAELVLTSEPALSAANTERLTDLMASCARIVHLLEQRRDAMKPPDGTGSVDPE